MVNKKTPLPGILYIFSFGLSRRLDRDCIILLWETRGDNKKTPSGVHQKSVNRKLPEASTGFVSFPCGKPGVTTKRRLPASIINRKLPEASTGFEPVMRVLQTLALPLGHDAIIKLLSGRWDSNPRPSPWQGDVLPLYYARIRSMIHRECRDPGSNWGHRDFQSRALPTELSRRDILLLSV